MKKKWSMRNIRKHKTTQTPLFTQTFSKLFFYSKEDSFPSGLYVGWKWQAYILVQMRLYNLKIFSLLASLQSFDKDSNIHLFTLLALITNSDMIRTTKSFTSTSNNTCNLTFGNRMRTFHSALMSGLSITNCPSPIQKVLIFPASTPHTCPVNVSQNAAVALGCWNSARQIPWSKPKCIHRGKDSRKHFRTTCR